MKEPVTTIQDQVKPFAEGPHQQGMLRLRHFENRYRRRTAEALGDFLRNNAGPDRRRKPLT